MTDMVPKLDRLRQVDLRSVWGSEPRQFTPWLAQQENLDLLSETLGLSTLELVQTEYTSAEFSCDIVAKVTATGDIIVIENQLERSDHSHLGQALTYAAGLDASAVIWIAKRFAEGHRAAFEWLNRKTSDDLALFAVEVEAWQIGESLPAPRFNVIARPNRWAREMTSAARNSSNPNAAAYAEYWQEYEDVARSMGAPYRGEAAAPMKSTNYTVYIGDNLEVGIVCYVSKPSAGQPSVGAYLGLWGSNSVSRYETLLSSKPLIEQEFRRTLEWRQAEGKASSTCHIIAPLRPADFTDRTDWPRQHAWLAENARLIAGVIASKLPKESKVNEV